MRILILSADLQYTSVVCFLNVQPRTLTLSVSTRRPLHGLTATPSPRTRGSNLRDSMLLPPSSPAAPRRPMALCLHPPHPTAPPRQRRAFRLSRAGSSTRRRRMQVAPSPLQGTPRTTRTRDRLQVSRRARARRCCLHPQGRSLQATPTTGALASAAPSPYLPRSRSGRMNLTQAQCSTRRCRSTAPRPRPLRGSTPMRPLVSRNTARPRQEHRCLRSTRTRPPSNMRPHRSPLHHPPRSTPTHLRSRRRHPRSSSSSSTPCSPRCSTPRSRPRASPRPTPPTHSPHPPSTVRLPRMRPLCRLQGTLLSSRRVAGLRRLLLPARPL